MSDNAKTVENFAGGVFVLPIRVERDPQRLSRWALLDANGTRADGGFRTRAVARVFAEMWNAMGATA